MTGIEQVSYDFAAGQAQAKALSDAELLGAIRDLRETIDVQEASNRQGMVTPKLGYYWDEYHTFVAENHERGVERQKARRQQFYLLSPSHLRQYTLDAIKQQRPHWDSARVSRKAMLNLENHIRALVNKAVRQHRNGVKTFMDYL